MHIGKVVGTVVCSQKVDTLKSKTLLLVQPMTFDLKEDGDLKVMYDRIGVGPSEIIYYVESKEGGLPEFIPVDAGIVGKVDNINLILNNE